MSFAIVRNLRSLLKNLKTNFRVSSNELERMRRDQERELERRKKARAGGAQRRGARPAQRRDPVTGCLGTRAAISGSSGEPNVGSRARTWCIVFGARVRSSDAARRFNQRRCATRLNSDSNKALLKRRRQVLLRARQRLKPRNCRKPCRVMERRTGSLHCKIQDLQTLRKRGE